MDISSTLQALRREQGLSQERLAELLGVSRQAVAKWESADSLPEIENLVAIASVFRVSLDDLVRNSADCGVHPGRKDGAACHDAQSELVSFLIKAKRLTYAAHGAETRPSRPSSHDLAYTEGDYSYYDTYLGGERFAGEEAVWRGVTPLWSMNYAGRVTAPGFSGDFLKDALLRVPRDQPFRGPRLYASGDYVYHCRVDGNFEWFSGREEIFLHDMCIYECLFHGTLIV